MVGRRKILLPDEQREFLYDLAIELKGRFSSEVWHDFKLLFVDSTITRTTLQRRFEEIWAQVGNRDEATSSKKHKQLFILNVSIKCLSSKLFVC